jgi:hypothetical protein
MPMPLLYTRFVAELQSRTRAPEKVLQSDRGLKGQNPRVLSCSAHEQLREGARFDSRLD